MTQIAQLGISVDSSQIRAAATELNRLIEAGGRAGLSTQRLGALSQAALAQLSASAAQAQASFDRMSVAIDRQGTAANNAQRTLGAMAAAIERQAAAAVQAQQTLDRMAATMERQERLAAQMAAQMAELTRITLENARANGQSSAALGGMAGKLASATAGFLSLGAAMKAADEWTNMNNKLKLVTTTQDQFITAQSGIIDIANSTRQSLSATADLYQKIAMNQKVLGLSGVELTGVVKTISQSMVISGVSAASGAGALMQLGQAFSSGVLRGQEFNSVMEQAPGLMQAISKGMGYTIDQMRALADAGKITAPQMVKALQKMQEEVEGNFGKMSATLGQAFTVSGNKLTEFIGRLDDGTGTSKAMANAIIGLSNNIGPLATVLATVVGVALASWLGAATLAAGGFALALAGVGTAIVGIMAAIGPAGWLILGLGAAATAWQLLGNKASTAGTQMSDGADQASAAANKLVAGIVPALNTAIATYDKMIGKQKEALGIAATPVEGVAKSIKEADVNLQKLAQQVQNAKRGTGEYLNFPAVERAAAEKELMTQLEAASLKRGELAKKDAEYNSNVVTLYVKDKDRQTEASEKLIKTEEANAKRLKAITAAGTDTKQLAAVEAAYRIEIANINKAKAASGGGSGVAPGESELTGIQAKIIAVKENTKALQTYGAEAEKQNEADKLVIKLQRELEGNIKGVARANKEKALEAAHVLSGAMKEESAIKAQIESQKKQTTEYKRHVDSIVDSATKTEQQAIALEAQNEVFGKSTSTIEANLLASNKLKLSKLESEKGTNAETDALKKQIAAQERLVTAQNTADYKKVTEHADKLLSDAQAAAKLYEDEYKLTGLTALERSKVVAQRQIELKYAKEIDAINKSGLSPEEKVAKLAVISQAQQTETSAAVNKVLQDDFAKTAEKINSDLTDALMRGFEDGKDFAANMRDTIVNMFKTMVLRPIVSAVVTPMSQAITGAIGGTGGASGIGNLSSLGGAAYQALTGASVGASSVSLMAGNAAGLMGGDAMGAMIAANGQWAGVSAAATAAEGAAVATAAAVESTAVAAAGAGSMMATALPYIGGAMALYSLLSQDHGTPTASTGSTARAFSATGAVTGSEDYYGGSSASADAMITRMQSAYAEGAKSLGIAMTASNFNFGGNTGKNGESPNFALGGGAGGVSFQQTETKLDDASLALAASRAVFAALQGSELPAHLAGVFDGITVGTATQEQITAALAGAQALATWHEQLTALPFDYLTTASYATMQGLIGAAGGLDKLGANLSGFYANFYSAEEKTAALTESTAKSFESLGLVMPELDSSARAAYRSMIEELGAKDLTIEANAKAYTGALELQGAMNELAPAMSAAQSSTKDFAAELMGFDAAGLGKMILDAAFNPQAGMTAAESFAQALQYSVQNALISSTVGQISDTLYTSIIMPIVAGNAVAEGAMNAVVEEATAKLAALGKLFESDAFKGAIGSIAQTVAGIMPSLTPMAAYSAPVVNVADTKVADTAKAANDALNASLKALGETSASLAIDLLRAQGLESEAIAAQRAIDIAGYGAAEIAIYDYNQSLRDQIVAVNAAKLVAEKFTEWQNRADVLTGVITDRALSLQRDLASTTDTATQSLIQLVYSLEDAKTAADAAKAANEAALSQATENTNVAMATLQRAVAAQRVLAQASYDAANESVTALTSLFDLLKTSINDLYGSVETTAQYQAEQARKFITQALATAKATGYLPESAALSTAITQARGGTQEYATKAESDFARVALAGELVQLQSISGDQLTTAERALKIAKDQLENLDSILENAQRQLDAANGINTSVISVEAAVTALGISIAALAAAQVAAKTVVPQSSYALVAQQGATLQTAIAAGDTATIGATAYDMMHAGLSTTPASTVTPTMAYNAMHAGLSGFASGGDHTGGLRLVGENGPEIEATGPSRIFNASQTRDMLGSNNARLESLVESLTHEVQRLRAVVQDSASDTRRTANAVNGRPEAPMLVETV